MAKEDVERGVKAIPGLSDTSAVAKKKISELRGLFSKIKSSKVQSLQTPIIPDEQSGDGEGESAENILAEFGIE